MPGPSKRSRPPPRLRRLNRFACDSACCRISGETRDSEPPAAIWSTAAEREVILSAISAIEDDSLTCPRLASGFFFRSCCTHFSVRAPFLALTISCGRVTPTNFSLYLIPSPVCSTTFCSRADGFSLLSMDAAILTVRPSLRRSPTVSGRTFSRLSVDPPGKTQVTLVTPVFDRSPNSSWPIDGTSLIRSR